MELPNGTFEHAKIVMTRWGQVLAFIELRDNDTECLRFNLWAPLGGGGEDAQVCFRVGLSPEAPDDAHDKLSAANREALPGLTTEKVEGIIAKYGVADTLDDAFAGAR